MNCLPQVSVGRACHAAATGVPQRLDHAEDAGRGGEVAVGAGRAVAEGPGGGRRESDVRAKEVIDSINITLSKQEDFEFTFRIVCYYCGSGEQ